MTTACVKSELDIFQPPKVQVAMEKGLWFETYPVSTLDGGNTIEFLIPSSQDEYINTHETLLLLKLKVTQKDGSAVPEQDVITPVNNLMHSLFSDIILYMNDVVVESSSGLYPFKSFIINGLFYSEEVKNCQLRAAGWCEDGTTRKTWLTGSKSMELIGALNLDFFHQSKYLLPGVNIRIKLVKSRDDFVLIQGPNQEVVIEKACLRVRRVRVNPGVLAAHEEKLVKENAVYPIQKTEIATYTIPTGATYHVQDGLVRGQLPKLVIVGLVPTADFSGGGKNTPLVFENCNLTQISLQQDGQNAPYSRAIEMDWTDKKELVTQAYASLFQNLEMLNVNKSNGITLDKFISRWALFAFNLTPDLSVGGECGQPYQTANLRLDTVWHCSYGGSQRHRHEHT